MPPPDDLDRDRFYTRDADDDGDEYELEAPDPAVLAILLTLWKLQLLGTALVLLAMFGVIGLYLYLQWKDKQHQDAAAERRRQLYAERREAQEHAGAAIDSTLVPTAAAAPSPPPNEVDEAWQKAMHEQRFRFQFSLKQLLAVMVSASVVMGMVQVLGGPQETASILGMIALVGLVVHAAGFDPPPIVALGWWLLLLMYVTLSIVGVAWNAMS
jgi:hypothetical protein